jgi:hypothetical protein
MSSVSSFNLIKSLGEMLGAITDAHLQHALLISMLRGPQMMPHPPQSHTKGNMTMICQHLRKDNVQKVVLFPQLLPQTMPAARKTEAYLVESPQAGAQ